MKTENSGDFEINNVYLKFGFRSQSVVAKSASPPNRLEDKNNSFNGVKARFTIKSLAACGGATWEKQIK